MPDISFLLIAGTAAFCGAAVQSGVGLGFGLVAAPVVAFVEPSLVPGTLLIATLSLPVMTLWSEWRHIDWHGLAWSLPARIPGALIGTWLVVVMAPRALGAIVGAMVLLAVAASLWAPRLHITPFSLMAAGMTSGVAGTATSIGGPPMALLYQHETAPRVRGTLAGFFLVGTLMSLAVLASAGELHTEQVRAGLLLFPFVIAGFAAGRPLRTRIGTHGIRVALLCVVTVSGVALIFRSMF
jgi:uncharacterized protein